MGWEDDIRKGGIMEPIIELCSEMRLKRQIFKGLLWVGIFSAFLAGGYLVGQRSVSHTELNRQEAWDAAVEVHRACTKLSISVAKCGEILNATMDAVYEAKEKKR